MDEKELLAKAATELNREGDIEGVEALLKRQSPEQFPLFLFMANAFKDVLIDPAFDIINVSGISWIFYVIFLWLPLFVWNFVYLWGKITFWRKLGLRTVWKYVARRIILMIVTMGAASLVPFVNMLFPQCLFILVAHNRHNRMVQELLAIADIFAEAAQGDVRNAERMAAEYAGRVASNIVRAANVSERVGDRFGERARSAAQRMEGNVTRTARRSAGRAIASVGEQEVAENSEAPLRQIDNAPRTGLRSVPGTGAARGGAAPAPRGDLGAQKFGGHSAGAPGAASGRRVA